MNAWPEGWEDGTLRTTTGGKQRAAKLKALGNAVLPQCAEVIGRWIVADYEANL